MTSGMIMMLAAALGQVGLPGTNNGMNIAWGGGFLTRVSAGQNAVPFRIPAYRFLDAIENGEALAHARAFAGCQKQVAAMRKMQVRRRKLKRDVLMQKDQAPRRKPRQKRRSKGIRPRCESELGADFA